MVSLEIINNEKGYLFVAGGQRYVEETELAVKRLLKITNLPICVIIDDNLDLSFIHPNLIVIKEEKLKEHRYSAKIVGIQKSPFSETIFMDSDTFVVENIDHLFKLFDLVDIFLPYEPHAHSAKCDDDYKGIVPELNSGVIGIKRSEKTELFVKEWMELLRKNVLNSTADMPYLRLAYIKFIKDLSIHVLPENYNLHGLATLKIIWGKVYVIHERFGFYKKSHSRQMKDNHYMEKISKGLNRIQSKRIYLPLFNYCISTSRISLDTYVLKFRKWIGFKRVSKRDLIFREK